MHGNLEEDIYIDVPPSNANKIAKHTVCKLEKIYIYIYLHWLTQSPRAWFDKFARVAISIKYKPSQGDHTLLIKYFPFKGSHNSQCVCGWHNKNNQRWKGEINWVMFSQRIWNQSFGMFEALPWYWSSSLQERHLDFPTEVCSRSIIRYW